MLEDREVAEANAPRGLPHDDGLAVVGEAEARGGDHLQVVCAVAARDRLGERGAVDLGEHLERTPLAVGIKDLPACRAADAARKPAVLKDEAVADHARHAEAAGDVRGDLLEAARDDVGGETVPSEKVDEVKGAGRRYGPLDGVGHDLDARSRECGHALAAWLLGDDTAKRQGRLSMNPFAHFDLLGTLCMVFAGVGWAKPVSTDPRNFKNPKWGMALTALAGPAANILLAYVGMVVWKLMYYWAPVNDATIYIAMFLQYLVLMNVSLAVFNLIPVPPLDGSRILLVVLPRRIYFGLMKYERYIMIALLAAVWFGALDTPLYYLNNIVWELLGKGTGYIDKIAYSIYYAGLGTVV